MVQQLCITWVNTGPIKVNGNSVCLEFQQPILYNPCPTPTSLAFLHSFHSLANDASLHIVSSLICLWIDCQITQCLFFKIILQFL